MHRIPLSPLTRSAFAPFGDVVDADGIAGTGINQGFATRFDGLASIDVAAGGGTPNVSLFAAKARPRPIEILLMERHPLGSQLFYPLQDRPWLLVVCLDPADAAGYRAFEASGRQGVNYRPGTWHHPLIVLRDDDRFLVVDRAGPGRNLEEAVLAAGHRLQIGP